LVAAILAAAAFIVAFLQTLLEYMGSSASRNICSSSAIGYAARQVKWGWSLGSWKLKVYYPLLDMSQRTLMLNFISAELNGISMDDKMDSIRKAHDWAWRPIESTEAITANTIADELTVMVSKKKTKSERPHPVTTTDLDWTEYIQFKWYRLRQPFCKLIRPRASWAQILTIMGIRNTKDFTIELADAETVPGSMDTPVQRVKLQDLGFLAFILGFQSVELDIPNRLFQAFSPYGTITTHESNVLGKMLRFEGDILAFHALTSKGTSFSAYRARALISGRVSFGKYLSIGTHYPLKVIQRAI
ncbi:hypothetical protein K458DRAFT_263315, partial [Lentithecium fluviatile CBS 122367]